MKEMGVESVVANVEEVVSADGVQSRSFDRRAFLKGSAIGMAGMMPLASLVGCAPKGSEASLSETSGEEPSAANQAFAAGGVEDSMSLEELNALRHAFVDSQTAYTCEDGSVVPEVYVKLRALFNTYGWGMGMAVNDHAFDEFVYLFSEDEAQAYLEMPFGVEFTATDFSLESGRDEAACSALCEDLAKRGTLYRVRRGGVSFFHHLAMAYGLWEFQILGAGDTPEYREAHSYVFTEDAPQNKMGTGTPFYYSIPVGKEVLADDEPGLYPYDDIEKILENNTVFAVGPCQCQALDLAGIPLDPMPEIERCVAFGATAQYVIDGGYGREITRDEAREILQKCKEAGYVYQHTWTKEPEIMCNCPRDVCGILTTYEALGDQLADFNTCVNVSHYTLEHDKDACIKCGKCMDRCPVRCISMDDEGLPARLMSCVRCGQCALVCPQDARKLRLANPDSVEPLAKNLLDDYNKKAAFRFANDMIPVK
ncbi:4Fe-4S binding protein [Adlercreutzia caecimuris]|uniref:4Fe-4S ferredoxin-type domain-containing protein n=1 Tax=Adlercreutzia caecimuris TaxID=671266 RepID=A0A4S4G5Y2_9ACTN|nr:4Fe-4S binding protein [Adlercreutzia caecimuris]THG38251.1 hypothetical protein E5986_02155 [Adlercreutzia caecimuris]